MTQNYNFINQGREPLPCAPPRSAAKRGRQLQTETTLITGNDELDSGHYELKIRKLRIITGTNYTGVKKPTLGLAKDYQRGGLLLLFKFDNGEITSHPRCRPVGHWGDSI